MGVQIYEQSPVTSIWNGEARTLHGKVTAETVVRATEGYTKTISGFKRALAPVYSLMLATEPLTEAQWEGDRSEQASDLLRRPTPDHLRPAHGRRPPRVRRTRRAIPFRLPIRPSTTGTRVHAELERVLDELFPTLRDVA